MYGAASIIGCERGTAPPFVWGKRGHDKTALVVPTQSLADHCADVAAAFSALLSSKGIATRVSHLLAGKPIPPEVADRLAYLVYLHDIGKCNAGFQARWQDGVEAIGHITPLAAVIGSEADRDLSTLFFRALNGDRLRQWGDGVGPLLDAIISHHGRPWPRGERRQEDERHWREQRDGYDPIAAVAALRGSADADLAGALVAGGMPLPKSPPFVHLIAGLTQLADWIASSDWMRNTQRESREDWARRRVREIGIDPPARSVHVTTAAVPDAFGDLFSRAPHEHQRVTGALEGRLLVLECETGSGKTEAALWRFAQLFDTGKVSGLYFALPTRTAAVSIHERVSTFAKAFWGASAPPVILAVPGYLDRTASGLNAGDLPSAPDPLDRPEGDSREASPWAAENPKRFFAAAVSVGTIDQALLAALRVKHAHLRGATLMRHLLVVDEVHASDAYMRGILVRLLRDHLATGGYALLLSATLGAEARHELLVGSSGKRLRDKPGPSLDTSVKTPYPLVSTAEPTSEIAVRGAEGRKRVSMRLRDWLDDPDAVARAALDAAGAGAKVLVVRNTVDGAVAVQRALERLAGDARAHLFRVAGVVTLHHGRYAREDRRLLDAGVEEAFGKHRQPGGMIVVGTQTLEQSLDIDADLLITDLCPADVLLQRVGRLHRHSFR
jgi:CRISPR-associated endonuclease/helicase Cas3